MPTLMVIDVTEITRADYYEAKKDLRKLVVSDLPDKFVIKERGNNYVLYQTFSGKFYKGPLRHYDYNLVRIMRVDKMRMQIVYTHAQGHPLAKAS